MAGLLLFLLVGVVVVGFAAVVMVVVNAGLEAVGRGADKLAHDVRKRRGGADG